MEKDLAYDIPTMSKGENGRGGEMVEAHFSLRYGRVTPSSQALVGGKAKGWSVDSRGKL